MLKVLVQCLTEAFISFLIDSYLVLYPTKNKFRRETTTRSTTLI